MIFVLVLVLLVQFDLDAQCAMCKESAASNLRSNPNSIARGLNSGILYLMAVPYIMIMFIFRKQLGTLVKMLVAKFTKNKAA